MDKDTITRALLFFVLVGVAGAGYVAYNEYQVRQDFWEDWIENESYVYDDEFDLYDDVSEDIEDALDSYYDDTANEEVYWAVVEASGFILENQVNTVDVRGVAVESYEAEILNPNTFEFQKVWYSLPSGYTNMPIVVLLAGGSGNGAGFNTPGALASESELLAAEGFLVVSFSALGVGSSEGEQDFYGSKDQDGIAAIIEAAKKIPGVNTDNVGLASFSYGVTGAAGVLARWPQLNVKFWSDWEGPSSRFYTTIGCGENEGAGLGLNESPATHDCDDDEHWLEREAAEAVIGMDEVRYYWRIQEETDHVQPTYGHTIEMLESAENSFIQWFRVNQGDWNTVYTEETLPVVENGNHFVKYAIPNIIEMSQFE